MNDKEIKYEKRNNNIVQENLIKNKYILNFKNKQNINIILQQSKKLL